jgi:hypothetical protein
MQHLESSGTPVLYIGRTVLKGPGFTQFMCILTVVADCLICFPDSTGGPSVNICKDFSYKIL